MRSALRILAFLASLAALTVIGGGHWAALQTAAWARMVVSYTRDSGSLRVGLTQTFDGAHPCKLCRQISVGIEKEQQDERQKPGQTARAGKTNLIAVLPAVFSAPFIRRGEPVVRPADSLEGCMADAPPVPPPRTA